MALDYSKLLSSGGLSLYNPSSAQSGQLSQYSFGNASPLNVNQAYNSGGLTGTRPASLTTGGDVLSAQIQAPVARTSNPTTSTPIPNNASELSALNNQFDYLQAQGNNQLNSLTGDYNTGIDQANTDFQGIQSQVGQQKVGAEQARDKNIEQAGAAAQSAQRSNRNTLRALGILNSSAAGELLSKPINEFGKIRADYVQAYQDRTNQLDDFLNQKTSEHTNLLNTLKNQYETLKGNIQNDMRFSDRQRTDAINAANAALSQRIAEIRQAQGTIKAKVDAQKLQLLQEAGQLEAYKNPDFNYMDFTNNVLIPTSQGLNPRQVGLTEDPRKKQGLDAQSALLSGGLSF